MKIGWMDGWMAGRMTIDGWRRQCLVGFYAYFE